MVRMVALKDKIEANSYAEVVKNALRLYEALIAEADKGSPISCQRQGWEYDAISDVYLTPSPERSYNCAR